MISQDSLIVELNVQVPMRDGTILYADIYRPIGDGKYPAVLTRTPYSKNMIGGAFPDPIRIARAGYARVIQDARGTGVSGGGEFDMGLAASQDGYDTIEWIATQPWCDGNVGMFGASHLGVVQWIAARARPPHLKTIIPSFAPNPLSTYKGIWHLWQRISSTIRVLGPITLRSRKMTPVEYTNLKARIEELIDRIDEQYWFLPLKDSPVLKEFDGVSVFQAELASLTQPYDREEYYSQRHETLAVPVFQISGWYDFSLAGVLKEFIMVKKTGASELARDHQKLLIGPWFHDGNLSNMVGKLYTGMTSTGNFIDIVGMHIRWFDYWLKGVKNGVDNEPPVRIFVMGDNKWRDENEWPLARTVYTKYYFHNLERANSRHGDGFLNIIVPSDERPDVYLYDPRNPVPTRGGISGAGEQDTGKVGAQDQQDIEDRDDVLVYTTTPLVSDLEVTGPIEIVLYASSSAIDTDFTGKFVDVWPDQRAYNLADGIVRARFRGPGSAASFLEPGKIFKYVIDLWATSNVFKAGHRIRVEISSSNFPKYDRNPNTGNRIGEDALIEVAMQKVFHNELYPSHIILPVIPP